MGGGESKVLQETLEKLSTGDEAAIEPAWELLNKDKNDVLDGEEHTKCIDSVSKEILDNWPTLDRELKNKILKKMVFGYVQNTLDPDGDGKISAEEFKAAAMEAAGDSLVALCEYSWEKGVRLSGAGLPAGECKYNPTILDVSRVRCPQQLVELTQIQRLDEPEGYTATDKWRTDGFPNFDGAHKCHAQEPGAGVDYCLTRMMDCRKPSGAFKDNVRPELMVQGRKVVQTCTADGYTRIDVTCGCSGCYC